MGTPNTIDAVIDAAGHVDLDSQRIAWSRSRWRRLEETQSDTLDRIDSEFDQHHTIRRSWLRGLAAEPTTLLVASMIWGFGRDRLGPSKVERMLGDQRTATPVAEVVADIVAASRRGAGLGFTALFDQDGVTRIKELGVAYGTKLIHFGGYDSAPLPRPLIYDLRVWTATRHIEDCPTFPTPKGYVRTADYERYCAWASEVAERRQLDPAMIEFVLFQFGGQLRREHTQR